MKQVVFCGGVGTKFQFGGELTKNKEIIARLEQLGFQVTVIDTYKASGNILKLISIFLRFFFLIMYREKASFVISTSFKNYYPLFKTLYYSPFRRHVLFWAIGGNLADEFQKGLYNLKYTKVINLYIVEGMKMKRDLESLNIKNVIYMPNFKSIGVLPSIDKVSDGKVHFLFLSRITPTKGCQYIIQAVNELNKKGYTNRFVVDFYGSIEDGYRVEFCKYVDEIVNINYKGTLQLQDAEGYNQLASYHFMLFPTYWKGEGFPGVIIDAYKSGVPIIASDWNFNTEFVEEGKTGYICKTHSLDQLCMLMEMVINEDISILELSKNCQERVMDYDTKNVLNRDVIEKIIS